MPVEMQVEPKHFFENVQKKGEKFLAQNPHPHGNKWKGKEYWRTIIPDLYDAYSGICAYTSHWTPYDTGWKTVEHFKPKDKYPQYAYLWHNYRFVCGRLNGRKGNYEDVLDPFTLREGTFIIDFPSLQLLPGKHLTEVEVKSVKETIERLQLNDRTSIRGRQDWLIKYLKRGDFPFLQEHAPFLAFEIKRQNLDNVNHPMWEEYHK